MRIYQRTSYYAAAILCMAAIMATTCSCSSRPTRFIGRTTLLVWRTTSSTKTPTAAAVAKEAQSARVISNASSTMTALGIGDAKEAFAGLQVERISDTQIVQIDVVSENPETAKAAADIIAAEVKKLHRGTSGARVTKAKLSTKTPDDSKITTVDPVHVTLIKGKQHQAVTTVMETRSSTPRSGAISVTDLAHIAKSMTVMMRTANTLGDLGVSTDPTKLLSGADIERIAGTNIIAIKVSADDPKEAKAAAEVWASEFKRYYQEVKTSKDDIIVLDTAYVTPMKRGLF